MEAVFGSQHGIGNHVEGTGLPRTSQEHFGFFGNFGTEHPWKLHGLDRIFAGRQGIVRMLSSQAAIVSLTAPLGEQSAGGTALL